MTLHALADTPVEPPFSYQPFRHSVQHLIKNPNPTWWATSLQRPSHIEKCTAKEMRKLVNEAKSLYEQSPDDWRDVFARCKAIVYDGHDCATTFFLDSVQRSDHKKAILAISRFSDFDNISELIKILKLGNIEYQIAFLKNPLLVIRGVEFFFRLFEKCF